MFVEILFFFAIWHQSLSQLAFDIKNVLHFLPPQLLRQIVTRLILFSSADLSF